MTVAAAELFARCQAAGLSLTAEGEALHVDFERPPPAELLKELRGHKSALLAILDWHRRHHEALAHWGALHPRREAEALAWGEIQNRWHRLHGARTPEWQCAGCGKPIGGLAALDLADGSRVHFETVDCLLAFGTRWRGEATAGLRALGLDPPPAEDEAGEAP
jgi:hypothetical protein